MIRRISEETGDPFLPVATYVVPCAICGKAAARFGIVGDRVHMIVFDRSQNPHHAANWDEERSREAQRLLDTGDVNALQAFLVITVRSPGCDAYCGECRSVYCFDHYSFTQVEWGEWIAECPHGHTFELH